MPRQARSRSRPRTTRPAQSAIPRDPAIERNIARYVPPNFGNVVTHVFTRSAPPSVLSTSTVTDNFQSLSFQLSDLVNYTELTAVYDQYQIVQVRVRALPSVTQSTPLDPLQGYLLAVVDYDDATNPSSLNAMLEYGNCGIFPANKELRVTIQPRAALAAYSGAFTSYANMGNMWIDVGSPSVQHYGLKLGLAQSTPIHSWTVFRTYVVRMRSTR